MHPDFLKEVVSRTRLRVERLRKDLSQAKAAPLEKRNFYKVFQETDTFKVIAETKKSSPSAGVIVKDYDPVRLSREYESLGFDAISLLTEPFFFGGDISDLRKVKEKITLPLLRKDFIIDELQIEESRIYGTDAILLIAKILDKEKIKHLLNLADSLNLDVLVEVFDTEDIRKVLDLDTPLIGINNRNLKTLDVDLQTTLKLLPLIPRDKIVISESGIKSIEDINILREKGVKGFLIGEGFLKSKDFRQEIKTYRNHTASD